jgi:hypothetical protein
MELARIGTMERGNHVAIHPQRHFIETISGYYWWYWW